MIGPDAVFSHHRLTVVAGRVGRQNLANVIDHLRAEGFVVAPPGTALVPSEWLIGLSRILNPEDVPAEEPIHPFTSQRPGAWAAVEAHVRDLPAVQAITTTGAKS